MFVSGMSAGWSSTQSVRHFTDRSPASNCHAGRVEVLTQVTSTTLRFPLSASLKRFMIRVRSATHPNTHTMLMQRRSINTERPTVTIHRYSLSCQTVAQWQVRTRRNPSGARTEAPCGGISAGRRAGRIFAQPRSARRYAILCYRTRLAHRCWSASGNDSRALGGGSVSWGLEHSLTKGTVSPRRR